MSISDPMEKLINEGLTVGEYIFTHEGEKGTGPQLDFRLTDLGVSVEVKRFYSDRAVRQLSKYEDVILVQGKKAVILLATLFANTKHSPVEPVEEKPVPQNLPPSNSGEKETLPNLQIPPAETTPSLDRPPRVSRRVVKVQLAEILQRAAKQMSISNEDLAERINISQSKLEEIFEGKLENVSDNLLRKGILRVGCDIEISVSPPHSDGCGGMLPVRDKGAPDNNSR